MTPRCPWCGSHPSSDPKFAGLGFNQSGRIGYRVFVCGYSTNAQFNKGCGNRDARAERDERTAPYVP